MRSVRRVLLIFAGCFGYIGLARAQELENVDPLVRPPPADRPLNEDEAEWIRKLESEKYDERQRAIDRLTSIASTRAIPHLLRLLATEERIVTIGVPDENAGGLRTAIGKIIASKHEESLAQLLGALESEDDTLRYHAAFWLGEIGPAARAIAERLRKRIKDPNACVRVEVAHALWEIEGIRESTVPILVEVVDREEPCSTRAINVLSLMKDEASDAIPALIRRVIRGPQTTRENIGRALTGMGPSAVQSLKALFQHENPLVRALAARTIGDIGIEACSASSVLTQALQDDDLQVIKEAARALGKVGGPAAIAVQGLTQLLKQKDGQLQRIALLSLASFGQAGATAIPEIIDALGSDDKELRLAALDVLEAMGAAAASALPHLIDMVVVQGNPLRGKVVRTIGALGREAASAVPLLKRLQNDPSVDVRIWSACALMKIEPEQREHLLAPILEQFVTSDERLKTTLIRAMGYLGDTAESAVPLLISAALEHDRPLIRHLAVVSLKAISLTSKQLRSVVDGLHHADPEVRRRAAYALGVIDQSATPETLLALSTGLRDSDAIVRLRCAVTLGSIPSGQEAISELNTLLNDRNSSVRLAARYALRKLTGSWPMVRDK